jgi:hypothetical protein
MSAPKRSTIYFDPEIHRTLRLKAAATDRSNSEVVNDAVLQTLSEDAADLEVLRSAAASLCSISKRSFRLATGRKSTEGVAPS